MALADQPTRRYPDTPLLEDAVARMARSRAVHGAILCVESGDGRLSWLGAAGNMQADRRNFIASVTKIYVTVEGELRQGRARRWKLSAGSTPSRPPPTSSRRRKYPSSWRYRYRMAPMRATWPSRGSSNPAKP